MNRFYLVPIETAGIARGPKYFEWRFSVEPLAILAGVQWGMMDYGFLPSALVAADVDAAQHAALDAQPDVYTFPENLDAPVSDPTIDAFFEGLNIPTDWLTPSTSYRELLRQVAGIFLFNQRYGGIAAEQTGTLHSIFDNATLNTRLRQMTAQEEEWFYLTVESFGFSRDIVNRNSQLRQLVKAAGDFWAGQPFKLGGVEF